MIVQKCCPECGEKLMEKELENEGFIPYCNNCKQYRFPMFNVAVSMIVVHEGKNEILLIQQYGKKDNILVAGYVNFGENLEGAVYRELKEEMNLNIDHILFNTSKYFPKSNSLLCNFIVFVKDISTIKPNSEVDSYHWFLKDDLLKEIKKDSLAEYFCQVFLSKYPDSL